MTKRSVEYAYQLNFPGLGSSNDRDALTRMVHSALTAMAEFNGQLCERVAAFNTEWTKFLAHRLEEDVALPQRLTACKSPEEAQEIYVDFWTRALREYQEEFFRLAQPGHHITRDRDDTRHMRKHADARSHEARLN